MRRDIVWNTFQSFYIAFCGGFIGVCLSIVPIRAWIIAGSVGLFAASVTFLADYLYNKKYAKHIS